MLYKVTFIILLVQIEFPQNKLVFQNCIFLSYVNPFSTYNHFHNIWRLLDVLPRFPFTTSQTMGDYNL